MLCNAEAGLQQQLKRKELELQQLYQQAAIVTAESANHKKHISETLVKQEQRVIANLSLLATCTQRVKSIALHELFQPKCGS
jgi:hypothetical protein